MLDDIDVNGVLMDQDVWNDIDPDSNLINNIFANYDSATQSAYYTSDQYNSEFSENHNVLSIFQQNVRSLNNKMEDVISFFESLHKFPDILILTETWLNSNIKDSFNINGCTSYHSVRPNKGGGGVSVFVSINIHSVCIDELCYSNATIESLVIQVRCGDEMFFILAIYRPHSDTIVNFTSELVQLLNNKILLNKHVIILGDLNVNLLLSSSICINDFKNELYSYNFFPMITKPTRFAPNSSEIPNSLLDHIWINFFLNNISGILLSDLSDHSCTFIHLPMICKSDNKIKITFRCHDERSIQLFRNKLLEINWCDILIGDVSHQVRTFDSLVNKLYCNSFPLKVKYLSIKRLKSPWIGSSLFKSIKAKSKLFKLLKLCHITHDYYKRYCNKLKSLVRISKRNYYRAAILNSDGNLKETWRLLNELMNKSKSGSAFKSVIVDDLVVTEEQVIASEFNNYFSNVADTLNDVIPSSDMSPTEFISFQSPSSFYCSPTSSNEINSIILNLKKSSSCINSVPVRILCKVSDIVSIPISKLVNLSFSTGSFFLL